MTAWLNEWIAGRVVPDDVIDAACGDDDEPPRVISADDGTAPDGDSLAVVFAAFRRDQIDHVRLVLPTPGDVSGLPANSPGAEIALHYGQAVVAECAGDARLLLVPGEVRYGSEPEVGIRTAWHLRRLPGGRHRPLGAVTVRETGRTLKECVLDVGRQLGDGDHRLAEWRQDNQDALRGGNDTSGLPALGAANLELAAMAGRMLHVVESTRSHDELAPALVPLDRAARNALIAAVST